MTRSRTTKFNQILAAPVAPSLLKRTTQSLTTTSEGCSGRRPPPGNGINFVRSIQTQTFRGLPSSEPVVSPKERMVTNAQLAKVVELPLEPSQRTPHTALQKRLPCETEPPAYVETGLVGNPPWVDAANVAVCLTEPEYSQAVACSRCPDTHTANAGRGAQCVVSRSGATSTRNTATAGPITTTFSPNGSNLTRCGTAKLDARPYQCSGSPARPLPSTATSQLPCLSTMTSKSKQPAKRESAILSLDVAIGLVNIGKEASSMTPAPAIFGVVTILLITIRVGFLPLRERDAPGLNIVRTRSPTNGIAWTSGSSALMSVIRLGGERMERGQMSSASRCAMR